MASKPAPAIRGRLNERYSDMEVIERVGSDTTYHRGLGDIGTVVEVVDMSETDHEGCPRCGTDEMIASKDFGPESIDLALYCTNLKCPHFVQDAVEYDMGRIRADEPEVWDQTALCPDCTTRHTVEAHRHSHVHETIMKGDDDYARVLCEECRGDDL